MTLGPILHYVYSDPLKLIEDMPGKGDQDADSCTHVKAH